MVTWEGLGAVPRCFHTCAQVKRVTGKHSQLFPTAAAGHLQAKLCIVEVRSKFRFVDVQRKHEVRFRVERLEERTRPPLTERRSGRHGAVSRAQHRRAKGGVGSKRRTPAKGNRVRCLSGNELPFDFRTTV